jgi:hypothetical protein
MVNYATFAKYITHDELELEYQQICENINLIEDVPHALDIIFKYHRKKGFPHYVVSDQQKADDMKSLSEFDESTLFKNGYIDQTMHALGLAWSYFPHWVEVKCGNSKMRPIDYWNDDDKLKEIIRKTWNWHLKHSDGKFTLNRLRQNFKIYGGNQTVSNFRPSAAKYIYNTYGKGGTVWDMSCGWGGRLIGFLTSNCKTYIGTDPSTKTYDGLLRLSKELNFYGKNIQIYKLGSEVFIPKKETVDLCFTSPPYFDTEKYSDEDTQSYKKYPDNWSWLNGFLRTTMQNCHIGLKKDGVMILNIANTPKHNNIEEETLKIANECGFELVDTIKLALSSIAGKGIKYEPIFIFRKKTKENN